MINRGALYRLVSRPSVILVVAGVLFLSIYAYRYYREMPFDTDYIYLYDTSLALTESKAYNDYFATTAEYMGRHGYSPRELSVYTFRYKYRFNYIFPSASISLARYFNYDETINFGEYIFNVTRYGLFLVNATVMVVLFGVLFYLRKQVPVVAVLLALLAMVVLRYAHLVPRVHWRPTESTGFLDGLRHVLFFLVAPGSGMDIFGITPRGAFTALLIAIFLCRWRNKFNYSYLLLLGSTVIHQTYAGLVVFGLILMDLSIRPSIFRNPVTVASAAVAIAAFAVRETMWTVFWDQTVAIALITVVLLPMTLVIPSVNSWIAKHVPGVEFLKSTGCFKSDMILLSVGVIMVISVSFIFNRLADDIVARYVWGEFSGRPLALVRVPLILGCAIFVVNSPLYKRLKGVLNVLLVLGAVLVSLVMLYSSFLGERQWKTDEEMCALSREVIRGESPHHSLLVIFYTIAYQIDRGGDRLPNLLQHVEPCE